MQSVEERMVFSVLAEETVRVVAKTLAAHGIAIMPLKGVLLARLVYEDPLARRMTDVDILVAPGRFAEATERLLAAGFVPRGVTLTGWARSFYAPGGVALDLHEELFGPHRYRFCAADMFSRSREDATLYRVPVQIPAPEDHFAYMLGKFASDRCGWRNCERLDELDRMTRRLPLVVEPLARTLDRHGLGRAARYVLGLLATERDNPLAHEVIAALAPDPIGRGLASIVRRSGMYVERAAVWDPFLAHLLNESLSAAAAAIYGAARERLRPKPVA